MEIFRRAFRAFLTITILAATTMSGTARELVFAADRWCPANCSPVSDRPGYMVEIAQAVFEPLGYTIRYVELNWARAKLYVRQGRFDGIFGAWPEGEPDFIYPRLSHGYSANGLFVQGQDPWIFHGPQSFAGRTVGLIVNYEYGEDFEAAIDTYGYPAYVAGDEALALNINKLKLGRIDVVVEDVNVFRFKAMEMGLADRFRLAASVNADEVFIAFSPKVPDAEELAGALDEGMKRLRASGDLARILARYGLTDWSGLQTSQDSKELQN
ncbi:substrate-binding periplasmic protein [Roseibium sp. M-1]